MLTVKRRSPSGPRTLSRSQAPPRATLRCPLRVACISVAWRSNQGATTSPTTKVKATKPSPKAVSSTSARCGPSPPVRRMVNSDDWASRARA